jgi:hypothetical protein
MDIPLTVAGLDNAKIFYDAVLAKGYSDFEKVEHEVVDIAKKMVDDDPAVKDILWSAWTCRHLPPLCKRRSICPFTIL